MLISVSTAALRHQGGNNRLYKMVNLYSLVVSLLQIRKYVRSRRPVLTAVIEFVCSRETAYCFAECEHPFLERFWKSVGVPIPAGANEPDAGTVNDPRITHESTQAYRSEELY